MTNLGIPRLYVAMRGWRVLCLLKRTLVHLEIQSFTWQNTAFSLFFFDFGSATLSKPCYTYYGQNNRLHTFTIPLDFSHCRNGVWHTKRINPDKARKTCCPNMHPQHIALHSQSTKFREYNNMQSVFNFLWRLITLFRRTTLFHIY